MNSNNTDSHCALSVPMKGPADSKLEPDFPTHDIEAHTSPLVARALGDTLQLNANGCSSLERLIDLMHVRFWIELEVPNYLLEQHLMIRRFGNGRPDEPGDLYPVAWQSAIARLRVASDIAKALSLTPYEQRFTARLIKLAQVRHERQRLSLSEVPQLVEMVNMCLQRRTQGGITMRELLSIVRTLRPESERALRMVIRTLRERCVTRESNASNQSD
jgi:hypothetical protein